MQSKQFKLIYFSFGTSEVKQISLGWKTLIGVASFLFLVIFIISFAILSVSKNYFHNYKIAHLTKANQELMGLLDEMEQRVDQINEKVTYLEKEDNDLRVFVDLPEIKGDLRKFGVGGHAQETYSTSILDQDARDKAYRVAQMINTLQQKLEMVELSREEIIEKYSKDNKILKQTPSIRPVIGGRITDGFGIRLDPFVDKFKPHYGIDFSVPRGTDVYATADGRVVETVTRYRPNHGYGKQVVIDHGYGYRTRYAHLQKVLVKEGQWVTRYTVIGKVGDTGRSTAPHLHYEVLRDGKPVNPAAFILE